MLQTRRERAEVFFFFNDTATTEIYTLSLHDALPILPRPAPDPARDRPRAGSRHPRRRHRRRHPGPAVLDARRRSEEHTSELQSRQYLVCRLLLEKKNKLPHLLALYDMYMERSVFALD